MRYADIIVDISAEKLDKTFQYRIPESLRELVQIGTQVDVPFGNRTLTGYVVELTDEAKVAKERLKDIASVHEGSVSIESELIALAGWLRRQYGSTMNQALKTVLPVRRRMKEPEKRTVVLSASVQTAREKLALFEEKHHTAKARLLRALLQTPALDYGLAARELGTTAAVRALEKEGLVRLETKKSYRNPMAHLTKQGQPPALNEAQREVVSEVIRDFDAGVRRTYLLRGVTGSGKTEVYMELIAHTLAEGRQAIVLIPEIALTYQTALRFYSRFGERVSIMNSQLSQGERFDQFERARAGDIDIVIGPRSALFTPFSRLGLIIIDEEHETSYKSETAPRYHAREVAIELARLHDASVLLGSATPSVDSYYHAMRGDYRLLTLERRVSNKPLPSCEIVDLRQELREGNRSILSVRLQELMEERLNKHEQTMLFLNRRGILGFISCRSCGTVVQCPHCDVALSLHGNGRLVCHYCGYTQALPKTCPTCGSSYLGGFRAGTQKMEMLVQKRFPAARILRMDFDTTRTKGSYEKILRAFSEHEADILIGTQMIVKGHDFSDVTLVGVLAADMSLHVPDYHAAERTFQLLTQAIGRAGRGALPGQAIIQTYDPEHYAIVTAQAQDYEAFYTREIAYRKMLCYPPVWQMLLVHCTGTDEERTAAAAGRLAAFFRERIHTLGDQVLLVGPADFSVARINDVYRKLLYMKAPLYETLVRLKDAAEQALLSGAYPGVTVQFDFNPASGF